MDELRLVISTAGDADSAREIGRRLVEEGLVACVNVVPGLLSIYEWKERLEEEAECLLVLKTRAGLLDELERRFHELHPYELPEFLVLTPDEVSSAYAEWILQQTGA